MKNKLDTALRVMAFVNLLACAVFGVAEACLDNANAAMAYVLAATWVVIYLVMREEE